MPRAVQTIALLLVVVWAAVAFVLPHPTNAEVDPANRIDVQTAAPDDIAALLHTSCFDCHTEETRWPWYTNVFPASVLVRHDVCEARAALNMSRWSEYSVFEQADFLDEMCGEVEEGHMPLPAYLWLHGEARLSDAQVEALCAWTTEAAARAMGSEP